MKQQHNLFTKAANLSTVNEMPISEEASNQPNSGWMWNELSMQIRLQTLI
jgi:hypothetical protein